jgi:hypothetical protein
MHRPALTFAVTSGLTHQFGHHPIEVTALSDEVTMSAVSGRDVVIIIERSADSRGNGLFTHVQMQESWESIGFGETTSGLFEKSNAHHAPV